jgi:hypothetical protein
MRALELLPFSFLDPRQHPPSLPRHVHSTLPSKPAKARGEPNRLIVVTYSNSVRSRRSWLAPLTPCHMSASHHTRAYIALISDSVFQITVSIMQTGFHDKTGKSMRSRTYIRSFKHNATCKPKGRRKHVSASFCSMEKPSQEGEV